MGLKKNGLLNRLLPKLLTSFRQFVLRIPPKIFSCLLAGNRLYQSRCRGINRTHHQGLQRLPTCPCSSESRIIVVKNVSYWYLVSRITWVPDADIVKNMRKGCDGQARTGPDGESPVRCPKLFLCSIASSTSSRFQSILGFCSNYHHLSDSTVGVHHSSSFFTRFTTHSYTTSRF